MASDSIKERNQTIDMVAQTVLDRLAERCEASALANEVVRRVLALQAEEAALNAMDEPSTEPVTVTHKERAHAAAEA